MGESFLSYGLYYAKSLKMIMWNVDSKDSWPGVSTEQIHEYLRTGIESRLQGGSTRLTILFHELDDNTRAQGALASFISTINQTIENFVLAEEQEDEEEDQTQFIPNWGLTTQQIKDHLEAADWVPGDPRH